MLFKKKGYQQAEITFKQMLNTLWSRNKPIPQKRKDSNYFYEPDPD